jgi:hypothetical protein
VEATQLGMGIGSAPEGANPEASAEALESGNGPTGIKALYIAPYDSKAIEFPIYHYIIYDNSTLFQHGTFLPCYC